MKYMYYIVLLLLLCRGEYATGKTDDYSLVHVLMRVLITGDIWIKCLFSLLIEKVPGTQYLFIY